MTRDTPRLLKRTRLEEVLSELLAYREGPLMYNHRRVLELRAERVILMAYQREVRT